MGYSLPCGCESMADVGRVPSWLMDKSDRTSLSLALSSLLPSTKSCSSNCQISHLFFHTMSVAAGLQVKYGMHKSQPSQAHWSPALDCHTFLFLWKQDMLESLGLTILLPISVALMTLGMSHDRNPTGHVLLLPPLFLLLLLFSSFSSS